MTYRGQKCGNCRCMLVQEDFIRCRRYPLVINTDSQVYEFPNLILIFGVQSGSLISIICWTS